MLSSTVLTFNVMPKAKTSAEIRREFGGWFKAERESRGISQKYVAEKVGVTVTQLSRIERGLSGTRRDTVISLAEIIGVDATEALRRYEPENVRSLANERLGSIEVAYEGLRTNESKQKVDWLIEMLEREVERIAQEEELLLAGNDASVNPDTGETTIRVAGKDLFRQGYK